MMIATPAKLRDGSWGARVAGTVAPGTPVQIRTRAGKTWNALVNTVVWTDGRVSLCTTAVASDKVPHSRGVRLRGRDGIDDECHTDGNCSSVCNPRTCPCGDGGWFRCC